MKKKALNNCPIIIIIMFIWAFKKKHGKKKNIGPFHVAS
jgi:hypothetical protein